MALADTQKELERLVVGSLYFSAVARLGLVLLLAQPGSLAGLVVGIVLLQISVGHHSLNFAKTTLIFIGFSFVPLTSRVLVSPISLAISTGAVLVVDDDALVAVVVVAVMG